MRNIKLTLEYDGTDYHGWQRQPGAKTVQETIEDCVKQITGEKVTVHGSGRTDSGVHALSQTANFHTQSDVGALEFKKGLNSILPKDIAVTGSEEVAKEFHAQFSSKSKVYVYKILNRSYRSSLSRNRVWHVPFELNLIEMQKAAAMLIGEHDFSAFAQADTEVKSKVRTVLGSELNSAENIIEFTIEADGFLKRMVRLIVGTLVQVGKDRLGPAEFIEILESGQKNKFVIAAPPQGLYLKEVKY